MKKDILEYLKKYNFLYYDYLSLELEDIEQIEYLKKELKYGKIDFFILINFYNKNKIYVQASGEKIIVNYNLKKIHNYLRINFNTPFSYKKVSKHSNFFKAKNIIKKAYNFKKVQEIKNNKQSGILFIKENLYFFEFKDKNYIN